MMHQRVVTFVLIALGGMGAQAACSSSTESESAPRTLTPDAAAEATPSVTSTPDAGQTCTSGSCGGGQLCIAGACVCPPYHTFCGGACIPTSGDAKNCGGCGVTCAANEVCSAGKCAGSCMEPLEKCGSTCVDRRTDSLHCGECGKVCPVDKGCVNGTCADVVALGIKTCAPAQASLSNAADKGGCVGKLAADVFGWAVCACKDVTFTAPYLTDGYDSLTGPYAAGGIGPGVGANETFSAASTGQIFGALWIAGAAGISTVANHNVKGDVRSGGLLTTADTFNIGGDAYSEGGVTGNVKIKGTLTTPAAAPVNGATYGALLRADVDVTPPCGFCLPDQRVPVEAIVTSRAANNDNASVALDAGALTGKTTPVRLELSCGHYYLSQVQTTQDLAVVAHGKVALYIDGDVAAAGLSLVPDPGAELDVFVKGNVVASGPVYIGTPQYAAVTRLYVNGAGEFPIGPNVHLAGNLYVPNGTVSVASTARQYGSIHTGSFTNAAEMRLHYDNGIAKAGATCGAAEQ